RPGELRLQVAPRAAVLDRPPRRDDLLIRNEPIRAPGSTRGRGTPWRRRGTPTGRRTEGDATRLRPQRRNSGITPARTKDPVGQAVPPDNPAPSAGTG